MESNPQKILMTADTVGGVWTYALELIRALAPHGIEVALATMGAKLTDEQWSEADELENVRIFESDFRLEWMDDPWDDVERAGRWLLELERAFQPDLVHLNGYAHGALPWSSPILMVAHSCVPSWWQAVHKATAPERWNRYREAVRAGLCAADLVVAPSQAMLDCLENHYGALANTAVIYNARRAPEPQPNEKEEIVLCAGRLWDDAKNIRALAEVAHLLPWPVCVAGDARHPNGTVSRFDNVRSLGRLGLQEVTRWYGRAGVYALPARYEPFGLSALEAANAGCALVLGDIPSLREIWGDAALFVAPDDRESLARTLLAVIRDRELRAEFAGRATARAREFTPERMVNGYLAAYGQLPRLHPAPHHPEVCA